MNFLQKIYKKSKEQKGFTLVEMIVVLVIIAILAAITIPALLKYIDKAREKQITIDARTAYLAAETTISEAVGAGQSVLPSGSSNFVFGSGNASDSSGYPKDAYDLAGITKAYTCTVTLDTENKITNIVYVDSSAGKKASMNLTSTTGGAWKVEKAS